jgi:hypothetical protein
MEVRSSDDKIVGEVRNIVYGTAPLALAKKMLTCRPHGNSLNNVI